MQNATQMAIITTDVLNVRTEPNTESKIWTQIVKDERYPVVDQQDGWVQIDLGSVDEEDGGQDGDEKAYISTRDNNVEVRYALNEAIKFTPSKDNGSSGGGSSTKQSRRSQLCKLCPSVCGNRYVWGGTSLTNGVDCSGFYYESDGKIWRISASLFWFSGPDGKESYFQPPCNQVI